MLQSPDSDRRACCETLDYFLRRLGSQQTRQRLMALKGLQLVLTPLKKDPEVGEAMEVDEADEGGDSWLLSHLSAVPCFGDFYPHISTNLRHACQVENDPATVGLYVRFLARFAPSALPDLADLCLDMSSIIVERSTILPAVLFESSATHRALLELFAGYTRRLLELGPASAAEEVLSSPEHRSEAVTVLFRSIDGSGPSLHPPREATLHFLVVHAQIILLTFLPRLSSSSAGSAEDYRTAQDLHETLIRWWFNAGEAPQVRGNKVI